jgi:hypothetical protein
VRRAPKIALTLALATVIVGVDGAIFRKDWLPLLWHLRHGRHVELNGIRFTVPLLFQEDHGTLDDTVEFYQFPGRFSKKTAAITIQFNKTSPGQAFDDTFSRDERTARFAEKPGKCAEYVSQDRRYVTADNAPTYIYCDFGEGWRANFSGSLGAKDEFYAFLADAKLVTRKD